MFASTWPRVVAAVSALVFSTLLGASLLTAPSASAVDLPLVGTAECDNAVDGDDEVIAAQADLDVAAVASAEAADNLDAAVDARDEAAAVLDGIQVGDVIPPGATEALNDAVAALEAAVTANDDAQDRLSKAQTALANARGVALGSLCTTQVGDGNTKPTTPVVTPAPSTSPAPSAGDDADAEALFARISGQIRDLSCDAYNRELGAIGDVLLAPGTSALLGGEGVGALQDQLNARNRALNFCFGSAPTPTTGPAVVVELDPLADDGSVADTDGTQITIVPAGSASTGGA